MTIFLRPLSNSRIFPLTMGSKQSKQATKCPWNLVG